jgi:ElaB/YqjD/DUF883 family membrane-anchored ribosome-binding protein
MLISIAIMVVPVNGLMIYIKFRRDNRARVAIWKSGIVPTKARRRALKRLIYLSFQVDFDQERKMTTRKLVSDVRLLAADAEELVKVTAGQTGEKIAEARNRIQKSVADLKPRLAQAQAALADDARSAAELGDSYVHEQPWTAIGIAAGVGILIGILIGRS